MLNNFTCTARVVSEVTKTPSGFYKMRLVNNAFKKVNGKYEQVPLFFNAIAFANMASRMEKIKKGNYVAISGELRNDTFKGKNGDNVPSLELIISNFDFLNEGNNNKSSDGNNMPDVNFSLDDDNNDLPL